MKIKFVANNRGFALAKFEDRYRQKCRLEKSSLAGENAIWLGIDCGQAMHLTQKQIACLLPHLQHFAETGELGLVRV